MTSATTAHNAKVMSRFDLTKRLVAQLKRDEAVVGGIGAEATRGAGSRSSPGTGD